MKDFLAQTCSILPHYGWIVTVVHEKDNDSPEGLGTIKQDQRIVFRNPNFKPLKKMSRGFYQKLTKELDDKLSILAKQKEGDFSKQVDSYLAKQQLAGEFKF